MTSPKNNKKQEWDWDGSISSGQMKRSSLRSSDQKKGATEKHEPSHNRQ
jgi:hypothetical protein